MAPCAMQEAVAPNLVPFLNYWASVPDDAGRYRQIGTVVIILGPGDGENNSRPFRMSPVRVAMLAVVAGFGLNRRDRGRVETSDVGG